MYVKDISGKWYDVEVSVLEDNCVDAEKAWEAVIAERAEKRKKIIDLVNSFDDYELQILSCELANKANEARVQGWNRANWSGPECNYFYPGSRSNISLKRGYVTSGPDFQGYVAPSQGYVIPGQYGGISWRNAGCNCGSGSGGCPECHCPECHCPECQDWVDSSWYVRGQHYRY